MNNDVDLQEFLSREGKLLLFAHTEAHAKEILARRDSISANKCIVIPTSVEPRFVFDAAKFSYRIPEEYYESNELSSYSEGLEKQCIAAVREIDSSLSEKLPPIRERGLRLAWYGLNAFTANFLSLGTVLFQARNIIARELPDAVGYFSDSCGALVQARRADEGSLWNPRENLFSKILPLLAPSETVKITNPGSETVSSRRLSKSDSLSFLRKLVQKSPQLFYFVNIARSTSFSRAVRLFRKQLRSRPVILLSGGYDWNFAGQALFRKGYSVSGQIEGTLERWSCGSSYAGIFETLLKELETSPSFRKSMSDGDLCLFPFFRGRISFFLHMIVPASLHAYDRTRKFFRKKKIRALLFSIAPTPIAKSIAKAAQDLSIPVIGWQHGDLNYQPIGSLTLDDAAAADLFLDWAEGSEENRRRALQGLGLKKELKVVGSASIDVLRSGAMREAVDMNATLVRAGVTNAPRPCIVYATTMYYLSHAYPFNSVPWSDNSIYDAQRTIIGRLAEMRGTKIVKLHPTRSYAVSGLDRYVHSFASKGIVEIRSSVGTMDLFSCADAIIVDMPSTTVIQAVTYPVPVFCLTKNLGLSEDAKRLLYKRAVCADDPDVLMNSVLQWLEKKTYSADCSNNEFLVRYGTALDGNAAERAAAAVADFVEKKSVF